MHLAIAKTYVTEKNSSSVEKNLESNAAGVFDFIIKYSGTFVIGTNGNVKQFLLSHLSTSVHFFLEVNTRSHVGVHV